MVPSSSNNLTFRRVVWATLTLLFFAFGFWLLYRFYQVIFILFIAIVAGSVIRPVVTWLYQRGLPRIAGVMLIYLLLLTLLIGFVLLIIPLVVEQGTSIVAELPDYYHGMREWMVNNSNKLIVTLGEFLPATLTGLEPGQPTGEEIAASAEQGLGYVMTAAEAIFIATAFLVLVFQWTLDGPRTIQSLSLLIPVDKRQGILEMISAMETKMGFFIAGQALLCLIMGVLSLIAYLLIGLPDALLLALLAGALEAVPMIGPLLGAIPAAIIALSISPTKLIWVVVATLITQQLENSLLVPSVMRKAVGINPFVALLAFFAFTSLFGIAGALMAVPIAAIIQLLLDHFVFHPAELESEVSVGRDYASRLRYETQYLAQDLRKQARVKKGGSDKKVKQIDKVMDEIETITTDLDALLAKADSSGVP